MTTKREKIQDRLQYIGLFGPIILLLTLFCTLIKGSPKSGYLFFVTLFSLPALWQWGWRGFWGSLLSLFTGLVLFTSFFSSAQSMWQSGAALSASLGLWVTLLGFEEIKEGLSKIKLESQSRLDNLIELDEKFQNQEMNWKNESSALNETLQETQVRLKRSQEEVQTLEKLVLTLREELAKEQKSVEQLSEEKQKKQTELSEHQSEILKVKEAHRKIEAILRESRSDREQKTLALLDQMKEKLVHKEEDSTRLQSQIQHLEKQQKELEERLFIKEDAFKSMQEALRQKVSTIHDLHESMQLKEHETLSLKQEIESLHKEISQKEHDHLTLKDAIKERDLQLQNLNQKLRDTQQDLSTARNFLDAKKEELLELKELSERAGSDLREQIQLKEQKIERQSEYIAQLEQESQDHTNTLRAIEEENELLTKKLHQNHEQLTQANQSLQAQEIEFNKALEREERLKEKQFQELRKLNEARFALFQSSLNRTQPSNTRDVSTRGDKPKHWLYQLEQLLKGEPSKKINFSMLPKDLTEEILTLHQTKSLYKQLRTQFDEKNEILEETRKELFHLQKDCEEVQKKVDETIDSQLEPEKELHKNLEEQITQVESMEIENEKLQEIISKLIEEQNQSTKKE